MFIHNLKYSLKTLFRNKILIFWTFAFPIILGTFFNMAFSNIENSEKLDIFNIAIVDNEEFENNEIFRQTFKTLSSGDNKDRLFNTKYVSEEKSKELLENDEIVGYIVLKDNVFNVVVSTSGINETILKNITDEIIQTEQIIKNISEKKIKQEMVSGNYNVDYEKIYKNVLDIVKNSDVNIHDISSKNLSYTMIEFYTLIAMTCLYGGVLAMVAINQNLANMSSNGKRVSVSSTSKIKIILSSVLASYITQLLGLTLLFLYTIFVLKVDFGSNTLLVIILGMVGSLAGLSMGLLIATVFKVNEGIKTGILLSVTMLGCFLSGMMGITMKYVIDKNMPIVNKLNPASMITDGFYSLYYYDTLDRFYFNIASLLTLSVVMIIISYLSLRRQKYDSI